ncbi:MAG: hypothetical protein JJU29_11970 [Verrucomicrobia bacterium]|nr:hypothetical protein [Verrucomicrobiota bacterium]MCH8513090.1 hypothetical protein [Kiritimatiellia bacterium]
MKTLLKIVWSLSLVLLAACGSRSHQSDFRQALSHEEKVGEQFAKLILENGHGDGEILVLIHPEGGRRVREIEARRIRGLKRGLGRSASNLREVAAGSPEDPAVMMLMNDFLPVDLLKSAMETAQNPSALISLLGYPYLEPAMENLPPIYVFGVNRQDLAREAIHSGWAEAALYSKGSDDMPVAVASSRLPPELLQSYGLAVRP